jgi:hypothetical protein
MAIRLPSGDFYADLGVSPDASPEEISTAFRTMARALHPDANPDAAAAERFKRVSRAYGVLSDPGERARYDAARARAGSAPGAASPPAAPSRDGGRLGWHLTRQRAPWVLALGIGLLALAAAVTTWVVLDPHSGAADATGRNVTLGIVAAKLVVGGAVAIVLACRRLRRG